MKKIVFTVEKTGDGYSAYLVAPGMGAAATVGDDISELKSNALEAYNALLFDHKKKPVSADSIVLKFDLTQFFEYYNVINVRGLAQRMRMNYTLLSQYITGSKIPSEKQTKKVLEGIKQLGRELYESDFI